MTPTRQRVNYDLIAHLYDEPGRDYDTDTNLFEFLDENFGQQPFHCRVLDMGCDRGKQLTVNHVAFPDLYTVGLDLFHGTLLQAHKRCAGIDWVQGDSAILPPSVIVPPSLLLFQTVTMSKGSLNLGTVYENLAGIPGFLRNLSRLGN